MIVQLVMRATVFLLLALAAALILRRSAAELRRRLWVGTFLGLLVLPAVATLAPPLGVPLLARPAPPPPWPPSHTMRVPLPLRADSPIFEVPPAHEPWSWSQALASIYGLGVVISLAGLVRARRQARRTLTSAQPAGADWTVAAGIDARQTDAVALPVTIGALRPIILLPLAARTWSAEARRAVLAHEIAHVQRHDPFWQLLAELVRAFYWWHPLVHLAVRQLRVERELAADDHTVLRTGLAPQIYAELLFDLACLPAPATSAGAVVPLLTPRGLKARVLSLLDERQVRRERGAIALGLLGAAALAAVATLLPVMRAPVGGLGPVIARVTFDGRPQADVPVSVRIDPYPPSGAVVVTSDARGEVRYPPDLPRVPYYGLYARQGNRAARQQVMAVPQGSQMPIELALFTTRTVSGRIFDPAGAPVKGATVRVLDDDRVMPGPGIMPLALSDRQGQWRVEGLLYGRYTLLVRSSDGPGAVVAVDMREQDVHTDDVHLLREVPVSGIVHDEDGAPRGGVRVEHSSLYILSHRSGPDAAYRHEGERYLDWDITAPDGTFRLLPHDYPMVATALARDGEPLYASTLRARGAPSSAVAIKLTRAVQFSVRIRDVLGQPVVHVHATALSPGSPLLQHQDGYTDDQGQVTLAATPPEVTVYLDRGKRPPARFGPYQINAAETPVRTFDVVVN